MLFGEENDASGRGEAMRLLVEIHWHKGEFRQAMQAAERACTSFRELGDTRDEGRMLYLFAQSALSAAVDEGAHVAYIREPSVESALSEEVRDLLSKVQSAGRDGSEMCRSIAASGTPCLHLLAGFLGLLARAQLMLQLPDDALAAADEAAVLFRDLGDAGAEGAGLVSVAEALCLLQQYQEAVETAEEASETCLANSDSKNAQRAQSLISFCQLALQSQLALQAQTQPLFQAPAGSAGI